MKESQVIKEESGPQTATALIARLVWIALGPIGLFLVSLSILSGRKEWLTAADLFYAAIVFATIGSRWLEYMSGAAQTAAGEPATARHVRRFSWLMLLIAACWWLCVKLVSFSGLVRF